MFISFNKKEMTGRMTLLRVATAVFILALAGIPGSLAVANGQAHSSGSGISCGHDSICKSIEGEEFDLILYSSLGSETVILYKRDKTGEIVPLVPEAYYTEARGTVKDAIYYLSRHSDYNGFRFKKARKSTGFFKTQVVNGLYVAVPEYRLSSDHKPPEYRFSEKNGKLTVRLTPMIRDPSN